MQDHDTTERNLFIELIKRFPVLCALQGKSLDQDKLGKQLDISTATTYRLTGWLDKNGLIAELDGAFALTAHLAKFSPPIWIPIWKA